MTVLSNELDGASRNFDENQLGFFGEIEEKNIVSPYGCHRIRGLGRVSRIESLGLAKRLRPGAPGTLPEAIDLCRIRGEEVEGRKSIHVLRSIQ
jgi:hypothetical protein